VTHPKKEIQGSKRTVNGNRRGLMWQELMQEQLGICASWLSAVSTEDVLGSGGMIPNKIQTKFALHSKATRIQRTEA